MYTTFDIYVSTKPITFIVLSVLYGEPQQFNGQQPDGRQNTDICLFLTVSLKKTPLMEGSVFLLLINSAIHKS